MHNQPPNFLRQASAEIQQDWLPSMSKSHPQDALACQKLLHAAHDGQCRMAGELLRRHERLRAQRDGLVNVLVQLVQACEDEGVRGMDGLLSAAHSAMHAVQEESAWN